MADVTKKLFTELFRPTSFENMVLLPRVANLLAKGLTQNVLLYSTTPGSGKTTIARILSSGYDTLALNGSSENGIDIIRNKIVNFASALSLECGAEKMKVVFIDEADGLTEAAWDALRNTIERYASSVRFICTCNKVDKIPQPIQSRFTCIPLYPTNKEEEDYMFLGYCNYIGSIFTALKIEYDDDTLKEFVRASFPDMRTMLNTIQSLHTQGAEKLDRASIIRTFDCSDLFELIVNGKDPVENYKFIVENYSTSPDDVLLEISRSFVEFIRVNHSEYAAKIPYIIITIAEYLDQTSRSSDLLIVLLACCFKLQCILKG